MSFEFSLFVISIIISALADQGLAKFRQKPVGVLQNIRVSCKKLDLRIYTRTQTRLQSTNSSRPYQPLVHSNSAVNPQVKFLTRNLHT